MNWSIETNAVQGTYQPKTGEPRVIPLVQSTTYKYESADHLAKLFDLEMPGHMYSRISNPTVSAVCDKLALLEGGVMAIGFASGMSAIMFSIMNICNAGDNILTQSTLYGGTYTLFTTTFKNIGIEVRFFEPNASIDEIVALADSNTKCIYGETIGNPGLNILDFDKLVSAANKLQIPTIVDNTLATPILCRPFEHGISIVVHSSTKYLDGHAAVLGGIVVDSGNFDWAKSGKFPDLTNPDPSYHGVSYVESFGKAAYAVKLNVQIVRNTGAILAPFNAYLTNLGMETLHLRMERHSENALKVAKFLQSHDKVFWVNYAGLEGSETYALAEKYMPKGKSGVLTFGVKGGIEAGKTVIDSLKLIALVVHVADARSCILHPASTTHRQLTEEELVKSGVLPDMIRLSVGIENADDLIADLDQALNKA